jgi:hypothetical protein
MRLTLARGGEDAQVRARYGYDQPQRHRDTEKTEIEFEVKEEDRPALLA